MYLTRYQYQVMFVSFITNTTGVTSEAGIGTPATEIDVIPLGLVGSLFDLWFFV